MVELSEEQIAELAPDIASLKSGRELSNKGKWISFAYNENVLWGQTQGSGKDPYRSQIDLQSTGFKCTCPSRKFPCKHGLGLYLLFTKDNSIFTKTQEMPVWVKDWIEKRKEKEEKKEETLQPLPDAEQTSKQSKAKEKIQKERLDKVTAGVEELELWLKDLLRAGFLGVPEKEPAYWARTTTRLIDAQAKGLSSAVRELKEINYFQKPLHWQTELLEKTSSLFLLLQTFKKIDQLPELLQEDIKSLVGISKSQKDIIDTHNEGFKDNWLVLAKERFRLEEDNITGQKHWLYGTETQKIAMILEFSFGNTPLRSLVTGTVIKAELVFYPSAYPLRAVIKNQGSTLSSVSTTTPLLHSWAEVHEQYVQKLATMPFLSVMPTFVEGLSPLRYQNDWYLADANKQAKKLEENSNIYAFLANTAGKPTSMAILYEAKKVNILGYWLSKSEYVAF